MNGVASGAQAFDKAVVDWRGAPSPVDEDNCWRGRHAFRKYKDGEGVQVRLVAGNRRTRCW